MKIHSSQCRLVRFDTKQRSSLSSLRKSTEALQVLSKSEILLFQFLASWTVIESQGKTERHFVRFQTSHGVSLSTFRQVGESPCRRVFMTAVKLLKERHTNRVKCKLVLLPP